MEGLAHAGTLLPKSYHDDLVDTVQHQPKSASLQDAGKTRWKEQPAVGGSTQMSEAVYVKMHGSSMHVIALHRKKVRRQRLDC